MSRPDLGPMKHRFDIASIVAVLCSALLGLACATSLEVDPISPSENPDDGISRLALDLSGARSRSVGLLSPSWFATSEQALAEARSRRERGESVQAVLESVARGQAALDRAESSATVARTTLSTAFLARGAALNSGAASLGEPFEEADDRFRELAGSIEDDDLGAARDGRAALEARYRALELRAIKEQTLGEAREVLARARSEGADERVPGAFAEAKGYLEVADAFIERQRYADSAMEERARVARFHAKRVLALNASARAVEAQGPAAFAREQERRLRELGEALRLPDRRDRPFDERWSELESAALSLRRDRDFAVRQNHALRESLGDAESEIAALTGRNRSLSRAQELDARFAEAREYFTSQEAEVYRKGGRLVIRLHALDFPVGGASIAPDDYALLTKVQWAIRTFGQPMVTIEGHTDSTGGDALNQRLSQLRANAVRDYLVANQVLPAHRILAVGKADDEPLASNETPEGRALNRRIDVILETRRIVFLASAAATAP